MDLMSIFFLRYVIGAIENEAPVEQIMLSDIKITTQNKSCRSIILSDYLRQLVFSYAVFF